MKNLAVVIDWYGPYTMNEALDASRNDGYAGGLMWALESDTTNVVRRNRNMSD